MAFGRKGAGPKYNLEMALALKKEGYDVYACIPSRRKMQMIIRNITLITYRLIHIRGCFALINSLRLPWLINEFKDYLKINRITHVYCTMPHTWNSSFLRDLRN
ncbi:hypothetical protein ACVXHB_01545 [Escherichia coli]